MGHEATEDLGDLEAIQCRTEKVLVARVSKKRQESGRPKEALDKRGRGGLGRCSRVLARSVDYI